MPRAPGPRSGPPRRGPAGRGRSPAPTAPSRRGRRGEADASTSLGGAVAGTRVLYGAAGPAGHTPPSPLAGAQSPRWRPADPYNPMTRSPSLAEALVLVV